MMPTLLVSDSFGKWLWERKRRLVLPALGLSITTASSALTWVERAAAWPWLFTVLLASQLLIIAVLLFAIPEPLEDPRQSKRASIAVRQFYSAWRLLWAFWLLEFAGLTAREFAVVAAKNTGLTAGWAGALIAVALNMLNNLPTGALLVCYVIASEKTVADDQAVVREKTLPWDRVFAILVLFTAIDIGLRAAVLGGWIFLPKNFGTTLDWMSGLGAGLATALLIGRLDSKFIGLPAWVLTILYGYAVIQTGWPSFSESPSVRAVLLNMALFMKCLLFILMWWLFRSGVFLFYIERIGTIFDGVTPERRFFLGRVQRTMDSVPDNDVEVLAPGVSASVATLPTDAHEKSDAQPPRQAR